jgi:hypothetical protein
MKMNNLSTILGGLGLGAALMYLLDPDRGNRRRAYVRDKAVCFANSKKDVLNVMTRDFVNRAQGFKHEVTHMLHHDEASDQVIRERVRSAMGRYTSHPSAISVSCRNGEITLRGPVLAHEVQSLVRRVRGVRGVQRVHNELEVHQSAEGVPALQGNGHEAAENHRLNPGTCLAVSALGAGLALYGVSRRDSIGGMVSMLGLGMIMKGFSDAENRFEPSAHGYRESNEPIHNDGDARGMDQPRQKDVLTDVASLP